MTWRGFLEYVTMRELGQEDAIARNYDIEFKPHWRGGDRITYAVSAAESMGLITRGVPLNGILTQVRAMLAGYGYNKYDLNWIETTMCEYYLWYRLRTAKVRRWRLKSSLRNPLI